AVVGAGLLFSMTLLLAGMAAGFGAEVKTTVAGIGADACVVQLGATGPFTSVSTINATEITEVEAEPGVRRADRIVVAPQVARVGKRLADVYLVGARPGGLGEQRHHRGGTAVRSGDAVVDSRLRLGMGRHFFLGARPFTVVGIVRGHSLLGGTPEVYIDVGVARSLVFADQPYATAVVTTGVPQRLPSDLEALSNAQVMHDTLRSMDNGIDSINNTRRFMWGVAGLLVAALMYVSALQRARDF